MLYRHISGRLSALDPATVLRFEKNGKLAEFTPLNVTLEETVAPVPNGRPESFSKVRAIVEKREPGVWVELGMTREVDDMGAGYSTPYFAWLATVTRSEFHSIDVKPEVVDVCNRILIDYNFSHDITGADNVAASPGLHLHCGDAMEFLVAWRNTGRMIDFLFLDAWDFYPPEQEEASMAKHLMAYNLIKTCLAPGALILIDDVHDVVTYHGKGKLLIPVLIDEGYEVLHRGYQFLFRKP